MKSFKDSDGDGIGDLNGIIEKLGYLKELGVDGAILSPVLKTAANGSLRGFKHCGMKKSLFFRQRSARFHDNWSSCWNPRRFQKTFGKSGWTWPQNNYQLCEFSRNRLKVFKNNKFLGRFPTTQAYFTSGSNYQLIELKDSRNFTFGKNVRLKTEREHFQITGWADSTIR